MPTEKEIAAGMSAVRDLQLTVASFPLKMEESALRAVVLAILMAADGARRNG